MHNQEEEARPQPEPSTPAASFKIIVHDVKDNGLTGRIEIVVKSLHSQDDGTVQEGPMKIYGIDADALEAVHGSSIESFLAWVKREHSRHLMLRSSLRDQLSSLKGKTL